MDFHLLKKENQEEDGEHIFIKSNLKKLKVFTNKIKWIEAYGDYVKVVTEEDSNLVLSTMKSFEKDLSKDKFIRVHKSHLVNPTFMTNYDRDGWLHLEDGSKVEVARRKKESLLRWMRS